MGEPTDLRPIWIGRPTSLDDGGPVDEPYDAAAARGFEIVGGFEVIEAAARRHPHKLAVDDGTTRLTYAEFLDRVYGLAERLRRLTDPNSVVASVTYNSAASPIMIMACAMIGRILAPIDAGHPPERKTAIFSEFRRMRGAARGGRGRRPWLRSGVGSAP